MSRLTTATMPTVREGIATPNYDRAGLQPGIAHIGVGGFHRAHQALVLDELMREGEARDWAIMGVGVRDDDSRMRAALTEQDGLYTVTERGADGENRTRVIGSIVGMLTLADDGVEEVLGLLTAPNIRIVSLTVTEGGYNISQSTGEFLLGTPDIVADLAEGAAPRTVFGLITEALRRRREAGTAPFTVMSCDNLQDNGAIARRAVLAFAGAKDAELASWIEENVPFPCSMVDRITPATTDADRAEVREATGLADAWPVVCEPFFQWVLEDNFGPGGRPPYERTRVQLVSDVAPYEMMKLRLLNGSHQAVAQTGRLVGYELMDQVLADPLIEQFMREYMRQEAVPTLGPVPGIDLAAYQEELIQRFGNPGVRDTVARVCWGGSDRVSQFVVPVIRDRVASGHDVRLGAAVVAAFARCCEGVNDEGAPILLEDERRAQMLAAAVSDDDLAFVRDPELYGDLASHAAFTVPYLHAREVLRGKGARALLAELLGE